VALDRKLRRDACSWTTYAEQLQTAGLSWQVYQELAITAVRTRPSAHV
jgi:phospholipase C